MELTELYHERTRPLGRRSASCSRYIQGIEQPVPPPPHRQQPRVCGGYGSRPRATLVVCSRASSPAIEPASRRGGIQLPDRSPPMPCRVEQHVPDRIPDLARRLQHPHVVAIRQQPPTPPKRTPHRPDHPPAERLHPPTERTTILRLDDEVCVIPQERVVNEAKLSTVTTPCQRLLERLHEGRSSQRRSTFPDP